MYVKEAFTGVVMITAILPCAHVDSYSAALHHARHKFGQHAYLAVDLTALAWIPIAYANHHIHCVIRPE
jgi:hypothetical protein